MLRGPFNMPNEEKARGDTKANNEKSGEHLPIKAILTLSGRYATLPALRIWSVG